MEMKFRKYLNINKKTIKETKKLILSGYFKENFIWRFEMLINLNKKLSKIYSIPISKIKVVSPERKDKKDDEDYIVLLDSLSLVTFLSKFKKKIEIHNGKGDQEEVVISRDSFDWALSVIQSSSQELIDMIIKKKEKLKEKEDDLEDKTQLNKNEYLYNSKGGKT